MGRPSLVSNREEGGKARVRIRREKATRAGALRRTGRVSTWRRPA